MLHQLVGLSIESAALSGLDPSASYGTGGRRRKIGSINLRNKKRPSKRSPRRRTHYGRRSLTRIGSVITPNWELLERKRRYAGW